MNLTLLQLQACMPYAGARLVQGHRDRSQDVAEEAASAVTGTEVALILTAAGTLIASVGGVIVGVRNSRKIEEVHKSTNGKMEQLLEITSKSAKAEGNLEGRQQQKDGA
jgi:hypothetical protein